MAMTANSVAAGGKVAPAEFVEQAGDELLGLPEQAEALTRELYGWVRTDSLSLLGAVGVGVLLYFLFVFARGRARSRLARASAHGSWGWVALKVVSRTRSFFLVMVAARIVTGLFGVPGTTWSNLMGFLFTVAAAVQGAFWAREFLLALVERRASAHEADPALSSAMGVLTILINVVVWAIAGIILLDNLGVNVTALMAGLGIGGIAIGLAAQGIFSDLFAALSILLDRPFRRGDTIQVGGGQGMIGTVENIGLKTTRFRALSGEMIVMSNANLLNQQINNFADYTHRRVSMTLQVIYQTDPSLLERVPEVLKDIVNGVPKCRFDRAHLVQFSASSLDYEMIYIVEDPDLVVMFDSRQLVMLAIIRRFAELGIDFAFPAQTSFLAGPDGRIVDPHPEEAAPASHPVLGAARKRAPAAER